MALVFNVNVAAEEQTPNKTMTTDFLPIAIGVNGVGSIYGGAVVAKNVGENDMTVIAAATSGDANAVGAVVDDIRLGLGKFSAGAVNVGSASITTQYGRGLSIQRPYKQQLEGQGLFLSYQRPVNNMHTLTWSTGLVLSQVKIKGFSTLKGRVLEIGDKALGDIDSTVINSSLKWDARTPNELGMLSGTKANIGLALTTGRKAQSDQGQVDYGVSQHFELAKPLILSTYLKGSSAFIVREEEKYNEVNEILPAINTQCGQGSAADQALCNEWKQDVAKFIQKSNTLGTATALGGSNGLRSYSERFFRSANFLLEGVEAQYLLPFKITQKAKLQFITFAEYAHSHDAFTQLTEDNLYSVGAGLRAYAGKMPIRLEYAKDKAGNNWYLTTGLVW